MEIYLIRHTKVAVDPGICYGQTDLPLADSFPSEWETLRQKIPSRFDALYASPAKRCQALAERINAGVRKISADLRELNFGDWEMKSWEQIDKEGQGWMENFVETAPPRGETFRDLSDRAVGVLEEVAAQSFETAAIVTHAGVIRSVLCHVLGMPLSKAFQLTIDYGKVCRIMVSGTMRVVDYVNL